MLGFMMIANTYLYATKNYDMANEDKKVTIGIPSLSKPTPPILRNVIRFVMFLSGLWALLQPQFADLPEHAIAAINKWLLVGNTTVYFASKFFGWNVDKPDTDNP